MTEHRTDLGALVKKYDQIILGLENQITEAKRKKEIVMQAINLLEKEGILEQDKLFELPPIQLSEKYAEASMSEAIQDILKSIDHGLSAEEIHTELTRHGYKSKSQNLKRDVYTRMYRLGQIGKLSSFKEGGVKKYKLPEKEKEAKGEQKEQGLTLDQ